MYPSKPGRRAGPPCEVRQAVDGFLCAIENAVIASGTVWSAGATLDATVPNWRLRATRPDAIRAEYGRWFADKGRGRAFQRGDRGAAVRRPADCQTHVSRILTKLDARDRAQLVALAYEAAW
jgi:hypothetical protein